MKIVRALLLFLLLVVPKDVNSLQKLRPRRQYAGNLLPSFSSDNKEVLSGALSLQECKEKPEIANANVRCGYSGCRVMCEKDYKMASGLGSTTLQCDHSSGNLILDGNPWQAGNAMCFPFCGVDGCLHGGLCIKPRTCECATGYSGNNCEITPEITLPALPEPTIDPNTCPEPDFPIVNAEVTRSGQRLVVRCKAGYVFQIGGTVAFIQCRGGEWDHPQGIFAPGGVLTCQETPCDPPCINGGKCLPEGVCDCPYKYWGPACQHMRCANPDPAFLSNSALGGVHSRMKIQCHQHYRMLSGRRTQTIVCRNGEWILSRRGLLKDNDVKCYPVNSTPKQQ